MDQLIPPNHENARNFLRFFGPILWGVGGIFTAIGLISFFASFGSFEPPRFFWCVFIGFPLLAAGGAMTKWGYMGAIARYVASEGAPVSKDAVNYMVTGTRDSIRDVASAIGEGLASGHAPDTLACPRCQTVNNGEAAFCRSCGSSLATTKDCPQCGKNNASDARFCDQCGSAIDYN